MCQVRTWRIHEQNVCSFSNIASHRNCLLFIKHVAMCMMTWKYRIRQHIPTSNNDSRHRKCLSVTSVHRVTKQLKLRAYTWSKISQELHWPLQIHTLAATAEVRGGAKAIAHKSSCSPLTLSIFSSLLTVTSPRFADILCPVHQWQRRDMAARIQYCHWFSRFLSEGVNV
jgi:hypothetical protein